MRRNGHGLADFGKVGFSKIGGSNKSLLQRMATNNTDFITVRLYRAWKVILREFNHGLIESHFLVIIDSFFEKIFHLNLSCSVKHLRQQLFLAKAHKIHRF